MSRRLRTNAIIPIVVSILFARAKAADPVLMSDLPIHPKVNFALIPLKPGAVQPEGWLRDWANSTTAGITGHDYLVAIFKMLRQAERLYSLPMGLISGKEMPGRKGIL
jgi:hypothetical protein